MRRARTSQSPCARRHALARRVKAAAKACALGSGLLLSVPTGLGHAQDLSIISPSITKPPSDFTKPSTTKLPSSFPKTKDGPIGPIKKIDQSQPLYLQGDELIYDAKGHRVTARGNIEIYYNNYILTADEVTYDQNANTLTATGNVTLKEPNGLVTRGERITLTDDFRDGFIQSLSVVARDDTRIAAERAIRREGKITEFQNGKFTPCRNDPGTPPLWCISAKRVIHDQAEATITYQDAQFELFGVPIVYLPYFQHADPSVKRQSGFLMPEYSTSTNLGFSVEVPYYFALAPNYDFTFHPMYSIRQGVLWQGDWRHRLSFGDITGQYSIKVAAIDQNASDLPDNPPQLEGWRGTLETKGRFSLSSWWNFGWDVTAESDDTFRRFYKLDNILQTDRVNSVFLTGLSERNYFGAHLYHFGGLLLDDTPTTESRVHPIIDYNYVFADPVLGGELSFNANALSFSRDLNESETFPSMHSSMNRLVADINWRRRFVDVLGQTFTPFANVRGDVYHLNDVVDPVTLTVIEDETVTRGIASGGLLYAYPFAAHTRNATHVVEPVGQIIARQKRVPQRRLPDEDARSVVFDDTNLFDLDKMAGFDRVETGTRANVGMQYTFQANSGGFARLLAGQSYHLAGDNIYRNPGKDPDENFIFSPDNGLETDRSDYVLGLYLAPSLVFRTLAQARFDENDLALQRSDVFAEFSYGPIQTQAIYSYAAIDPATGDETKQQDIFAIAGLKLTDRWSLLGSLRFDLDDGSRIQDSLQLRYADECFVLTATYTETFIDNSDRGLSTDQALMLRFEWKYLGEFRYKTDVLDHFFAENQPPT
jgi:LPS-assembly protein